MKNFILSETEKNAKVLTVCREGRTGIASLGEQKKLTVTSSEVDQSLQVLMVTSEPLGERMVEPSRLMTSVPVSEEDDEVSVDFFSRPEGAAKPTVKRIGSDHGRVTVAGISDVEGPEINLSPVNLVSVSVVVPVKGEELLGFNYSPGPKVSVSKKMISAVADISLSRKRGYFVVGLVLIVPDVDPNVVLCKMSIPIK